MSNYIVSAFVWMFASVVLFGGFEYVVDRSHGFDAVNALFTVLILAVSVLFWALGAVVLKGPDKDG